MFYAEMEQAEKDPEVHVLSRQFKAVAGELISLLEQVTYVDRFEAFVAYQQHFSVSN